VSIKLFNFLTTDSHVYVQEIGFTHMRILEGVGTLIQLGGLMARLCKMVRSCSALAITELTMDMQNIKPEHFVI
jgi:hypothetical protein